MAHLYTQTASEPPLDGSSLIIKMLQSKISALSHGIIITDDFISTVEDFAKRNSLSSLHKDLTDLSDIEESCPRCLKAHMFSSAVKQGLDRRAIKTIEELVEGEVGHNGYYLDEGEVKPVQSEPLTNS